MAPTEEYSRADIRRKFGLTERQLQSWEKQSLIAVAAQYTFSDLIAFQTIIKLRENRIPAREISRALESLRQKLSWVKQPLSELRIVSDGRRITVHVGGQKAALHREQDSGREYRVDEAVRIANHDVARPGNPRGFVRVIAGRGGRPGQLGVAQPVR